MTGEAPCREGQWWYWSRTMRGQQYPVYLRCGGGAGGPQGPEQVLLDHNELAAGKPFLSWARWR
jgi:oligopeptidase B